MLNLELHCHNVFSNYRNGSKKVPFDSGVAISEQLNAVLEKNIDVLFVTNHNTLDGYSQILEYQNNHEKFKKITIYPAEEITIDTGGHILAYGLHKEISRGLTFEETIDEIKKQNAVSCAAHPFAVTNGVREKSKRCDLIESFNSNNIDTFSNQVAKRFAKENNLLSVAGSDAHVTSTIGRCINTLESENNLDSILYNMSKGKIQVIKEEYASKREIYEHAYYILSSSKDLLLKHALNSYPRYYWAAKMALNSYTKNPNNPLWRFLGSMTLYLTKRASMKVNVRGYDPKVFENRSWKTLISMSLIP